MKVKVSYLQTVQHVFFKLLVKISFCRSHNFVIKALFSVCMYLHMFYSHSYISSTYLITTHSKVLFSHGSILGSPAPYHFNIPHSLALAEDKNLLYVADRENGRIQVFHASNGTFAFQFSSALMGSRIFSVAYTPAFGELPMSLTYNTTCKLSGQ